MASLTPIVDSLVDTTSNDPTEAPKCNFGLAGFKPRILGIGTAVPDTSYTQEELLDKFRVTDPKVRPVFLNSAIQRRYLTLPPEGTGQPESQGQLPAKHLVQGLDMGNRALNECMKEAGAEVTDIRYLVCVSSTGFLTPGFTALMIRELVLDPSCARLDVVGMGCDAGLNGLTAVAGWAAALLSSAVAPAIVAGDGVGREGAVADSYAELPARRANELTVGDPWREEVSLGPLIDTGQLKRASDVVAESVAGGTRVLAGGTHRDLYYAPRVLDGVTREMPAFREEIFGQSRQSSGSGTRRKRSRSRTPASTGWSPRSSPAPPSGPSRRPTSSGSAWCISTIRASRTTRTSPSAGSAPPATAAGTAHSTTGTSSPNGVGSRPETRRYLRRSELLRELSKVMR